MRCEDCEIGEYHGLPPKGSPEWYASTVYFWCPVKRHHNMFGETCDSFEQGQPRKFDKRGRPLD